MPSWDLVWYDHTRKKKNILYQINIESQHLVPHVQVFFSDMVLAIM